MDSSLGTKGACVYFFDNFDFWIWHRYGLDTCEILFQKFSQKRKKKKRGYESNLNLKWLSSKTKTCIQNRATLKHIEKVIQVCFPYLYL